MTTGSNSTATLTLEEERQHLERLLAQQKRNLQRLEQVKAKRGLDTPITTLNELDYERGELAWVQAMLRALKATPDPLTRLVGQVRALLEAVVLDSVAAEWHPGRDSHRFMIFNPSAILLLDRFHHSKFQVGDGSIPTWLLPLCPELWQVSSICFQQIIENRLHSVSGGPEGVGQQRLVGDLAVAVSGCLSGQDLIRLHLGQQTKAAEEAGYSLISPSRQA